MKKRRRHKKCLNCGYSLKSSDNYCHNCGQENTDNEIGIGLLLREFTSNFFSLDSRFGRTLKPFLFNPGKVTNAFNAGKRVFYANPIRWYLVISIFHFFFFAKVADPDTSNTKGRGFVVRDDENQLTQVQFDSLYNLPDSLHNTEDWPFPEHYFDLIDHLNKNEELGHQEIMDSLKLDTLPMINRLAARQIIKINHDSADSLNEYIIRQIPIIVFFILPLYAFILKLFYWRKGLYIKHLIHSLHIHSFLFFVLGVGWVIRLIIGVSIENTSPTIATGISAIYVLISLKNVYKVKWGWTILRYFMIGILYSIVLSFSLLVGVFISLAFY